MASHSSLWNWTRHWLPASLFSERSDAGFLPSNPSGNFRTLEELTERKFLVLLGDPGSGKSVETRKESERVRNQLGPSAPIIYLDGRTTIQSDATLDRFWFKSKLWVDWQGSSDDIWIFFDGFDESVQHIKGLTEIIRHELHQVLADDVQRTSRLFLRIASRTVGWQPELGDALSLLLYPSVRPEQSRGQYTLHLAPPRWDDIAIAAESRGINGRDFCERVREQGVEALVLRPAQLEWLLNIFEAGGELPEDKEHLYWEGMRQLCQDSVQAIDAEHLRALAGRVAFVTMFGGLRSLWLDLDRGDVPHDSIALTRFVGGVEQTTRGDEVPVTQEILRGLASSGLFTSGESGQAVWAHQSYPEYLAAKYAITRKLPLSQTTGLITNPLDTTQRVLSSMVEVAAWMAAMNEEVFGHLLHHDPAALIESDVALTDAEDRGRLVRAFLSNLASGQLVQTRWPQKGQYESLCFPEMGDVLTRFITDKGLGKDPRATAIDLAVDCRLRELGDVLAAVALDAMEPEVIRRSAAWAVTDIGDERARQSLKPLISCPADEDPFEELKGCAMRANWPINLSIDELTEHLTAPRWYGVGAYRLFLSQSFVHGLKDDDLLPALRWLGGQAHWEDRNQHELNEIEAHLISRAFENFDDPQIADWLVGKAASNLARHQKMFGEATTSDTVTESLASPDRRRTLINALAYNLQDTQKSATVAFMVTEYLRHHTDWVAEDYSWMAQQFRESEPSSALEVFWLHLLKGTFSVTDLEQTSVLYELYVDERFTEQFADWFAPVDLRSPEVIHQKERWSVLKGGQERDQEPATPRMDVETYIADILERVEGGRSLDWWQTIEWLKTDERAIRHEAPWITDIRELPGWQLCSQATQHWIADTALGFLHAYTSRNDHLGTSTYYLDSLAAYRALVLLLRERPSDLDTLPSDTWHRLGPMVMGMYPHASGEQIPHQEVFLEKAMDAGFDPIPWLVTMGSRAEEGSPFFFSPAVRAVVLLLPSNHLEQLAENLIRFDMPMSTLLESARALCGRGVQSAFTRTLELIKLYAEDPATVDKAATIATVLMECGALATWQDLWVLLESNDDLFDRAFMSYGHWHHDAGEFARDLDERAVARLYRRLAERFPPSEDPNIGEFHAVSPRESLGRWREQLLSSLALRGTWEAVQELRELRETYPNIDWLCIRVAQAEEAARLQTWQPLATHELLRLVKQSGARIIRSAGQLHDVILESLDRLQSELLAESPAAVDLWNVRSVDRTGTPKDEVLISDKIKRHLDRDLQHLGVTVNREVENRLGNEIDVYVQYSDSATPSPITVVCEVKGCWHRELYTSMSRQLHERYMKQQGLSHGIYLVAFFDGNRWDPDDCASRHKAPRHSLEDLKGDMVNQAAKLTDDAFRVTSVVLDCHY